MIDDASIIHKIIHNLTPDEGEQKASAESEKMAIIYIKFLLEFRRDAIGLVAGDVIKHCRQWLDGGKKDDSMLEGELKGDEYNIDPTKTTYHMYFDCNRNYDE